MKREIALLFAMAFFLGNAAEAAPKAISGDVVFEDDHKAERMPGFRFIDHVPYGSYMTNMFGAPGAQITVKNAKSEIVGVGTSNPDGTFKISVSPSTFYQLSVGYNGRSTEKTMSAGDAAKQVRIDMGRFQDY